MSKKSPNPDSTSATCQETSGFLFPHPCAHIAQSACHRCAKPICNQHAVYDQGNNLCISCSKLSTEDRPQHEYDDDDPFWYRHHHYTTYSWYHDDFTEGDESVLIGGEDEDVKWENDMGAS